MVGKEITARLPKACLGNGSSKEEHRPITAEVRVQLLSVSHSLMDNLGISTEDWNACLRVLQTVSEDPAQVSGEERFKALVAKIHKEGKRGVRRDAQEQRQSEDQQTKAETGLVRAQTQGDQEQGQSGLTWGALQTPARCYICKHAYTRVHPWYHLLCPDCAEFNAGKRTQRADLTGRTALVTGGRVKIGYLLVLRLLRDGAGVIATTRFPADAARRFAAEPDYGEWAERLHIVGLDLRHLPSVENFCEDLLAGEAALDLLVNNAAQTVQRPPEFYKHLLDAEETALLETRPEHPANDLALTQYFPAGEYDRDGQQLDLRPVHSWRLRLGEVGTREMLETQLVNAAAPFILNSRLKPLLLRSAFARRFIVNVSAMEGQFGRESKTIFHPHTNMAKAALNMMTRTSAADYARDGIYMNSVDTGWVTDENPYPQRVHAQERGFWTPLDAADAVARIYDPIARGITDPAEPLFGHFLKDYAPYAW